MDIGIGTDIDIGADEEGIECVGVGIGTGIDVGVDRALSVINCWKRMSNTIAACRSSRVVSTQRRARFQKTTTRQTEILFAHHEPIEHPDHLSVAPLNRSDHVIASQTPLEVFEFCPPSTLR
jgi:hypothetical protein